MTSERTVQIELEGVTKSYGDAIVLRDIDLVIHTGEFVSIVGQSGSGKSTLLKLVGGMAAPDSGAIRHEGRDLAALTERERARFRRASLGFVFQFFNLIPTLTGLENVALPLTLNGRLERDARTAAQALLDELGVKACATRFPDQMSGGEQQRVAIARALVHAPALVIADEPTGNLDAARSTQVLERLEQACRDRRTTLLVATHSNEIARRADRALGIRDAGLVETA